MKRSEHVEQREFVQWWRKTYPDLWIFAIPNGGWRTPATALKLKLEGVSPGVPDLFVPSLRLFIEMKATDGKLSKAQEVWFRHLTRCGFVTMVAYGFEDAKAAIYSLLEMTNPPPDAPIN